jgi:ATPase family associated with various cellular activities (AAA)
MPTHPAPDSIFANLEAMHAHALPRVLTQRLRERFPAKSILATFDGAFRVDSYAFHTAEAKREPSAQHVNLDPVELWHDGLRRSRFSGHEQVQWRAKRFELFTATLPTGYDERTWQWLVGDDEVSVNAFFTEVARWNNAVHGEILIFEGGCFCKSKALQDDIANFSLDDLVLTGDLGTTLRNDLRRFIDAKATYAKAKVPWKRGLLLIGPPGNGKTHAVKGLLHDSKLPCLYVKSFSGRRVDPHDTIPKVFDRARAMAPCIVVLEDLDALIDDENRSLLLNELDGFARNEGLITIATTNHPERLDPSLLHRPSRFDRKFHFPLPALEERRRYLERWANQLDPHARPTTIALAAAAEATAGFTFAYLKEATVSTLVQWVSDGQGAIDVVLATVVGELKQELASLPSGDGPSPAKPKAHPPWDF